MNVKKKSVKLTLEKFEILHQIRFFFFDQAVRYDDKNVIVSSSDNSTNSKYAVIPFFLTSQKFSEESPEYDYSIAAKFGRSSKSFDACQTKYSCPIDLTELKTKFIWSIYKLSKGLGTN